MSHITVYHPNPAVRDATAESPPAEREHIDAVMRADAASLALEVRSEADTELELKRLAVRHAGGDYEDALRRRAEAQAKERFDERGGRGKSWLYRVAALTGAGAEFAITWSVLPWAFGIRQHSLLGVCVSAAPVAGVVLFKEAIERLIRPAFTARLSENRSLASRLAIGLEWLFLATVSVALGLAMVTQIAGTRELAFEVSQLLGSGQTAELTAADKATLATTVLVIALFVSVASASLFGYASLYAWAGKTARNAKAALKKLLPECDEKRKALRQAETECARAEVTSRYAPARAAVEEQKYIATQGAHLERYGRRPAEKPPEPEQPLLTLASVETALTGLVLGPTSAPRPTKGANGHASS
jgi:hypothetical protein